MLNETQLIQVMNHVLACLQRYKLEKSSYPDNLAATASVPGCSSLDANPGKVVGYTLSYGPMVWPVGRRNHPSWRRAQREGGSNMLTRILPIPRESFTGTPSSQCEPWAARRGRWCFPRFGAAWRDLHPRSRILTPIGSFGIFKTGVLIDPVNGKTRVESLCSEWQVIPGTSWKFTWF